MAKEGLYQGRSKFRNCFNCTQHVSLGGDLVSGVGACLQPLTHSPSLIHSVCCVPSVVRGWRQCCTAHRNSGFKSMQTSGERSGHHTNDVAMEATGSATEEHTLCQLFSHHKGAEALESLLLRVPELGDAAPTFCMSRSWLMALEFSIRFPSPVPPGPCLGWSYGQT